jgi:hypothetical protein
MGSTTETEIRELVSMLYLDADKIYWKGPVDDKDHIGRQILGSHVQVNNQMLFAPFLIGDEWTMDLVRQQFWQWNSYDSDGTKNQFFARYPDLAFGNVFACHCGAKHTSNPNLHSYWCPLYV